MCWEDLLEKGKATLSCILAWRIPAGIKIARRNINNLRYADDTTLMAENKEKLKSLLMRVNEESEKASLKLDIQKLRSWHLVPSLHGKNILLSWSPISLWMVTATTKLKDNCYLEEKIMTNLNSVLKSRDITLLTKVLIVKAVVVPVVMFGCES